jgi:hypothetical protein
LTGSPSPNLPMSREVPSGGRAVSPLVAVKSPHPGGVQLQIAPGSHLTSCFDLKGTGSRAQPRLSDWRPRLALRQTCCLPDRPRRILHGQSIGRPPTGG